MDRGVFWPNLIISFICYENANREAEIILVNTTTLVIALGLMPRGYEHSIWDVQLCNSCAVYLEDGFKPLHCLYYITTIS